MLLNRGQGPGGRILSEASFGLLTRRAIKAEDETYYGCGLALFDDEGHACLGHGGGMVGYTAAIIGDLDEGWGVAALSNGQRGVGEVARATLHILRGLDVPPPTSPAYIENSGDYAGVYRNGDRMLTVEAEGAGLFVRHGGQRVPLEAAGGKDRFHVLHPDFARYLLRFGRAGGRVVEAFHGPDWYVGEGYEGPTDFDTPAEWLAFPGHYRAFNPWYSNFRVVLRKGSLALIYPDGEEQPLIPAGEAAFRVGADERLPERLRFDLLLDGRAEQANLAGGAYSRTFTP
jgi:hypothetical protein